MKLIKQATVYQALLPNDPAVLSKHLAELSFTDMGETDYCRSGFIPPQGATCSDQLVVRLPGVQSVAFAMRYDEKIIPAAVTKAELAKKCDHFNEAQGRQPTRKEVRSLRDDVLAELKARALSRSYRVDAFYNPITEILVVATTNAKLADRLMSDLVKVVGSVKTQTIHIDDLKGGLTTRLKETIVQGLDDRFGDFSLVGDYWLKLDKERVNIQLGDPESDTLREALNASMQVEALRLKHGVVTFKLGADFRFKGIAFDEAESTAAGAEAADLIEFWQMQACFEFINFEAVITSLCQLVSYKPQPLE